MQAATHADGHNAPAAASAATPLAAAADSGWTDITSRLSSAASRLLPLGRLLSHPSFTLKESMMALELGDVKMDSGCHIPTRIISVDRALDSGSIVPGEKLSVYQQLEVIDELLACEVTSYTGSSVAHTLYTCIYLHRLTLIWDSAPLLSCYVALLLKSVEMLRSVVICADIQQEEDFQYNLNGLRLGAMDVPQDFHNASTTAQVKATSVPTTAVAAAGEGKEQSPYEVLYAGLSMAELRDRFSAQHATIAARVTELRAAEAAAGRVTPDSELYTPATANSSELHLYTLLLNRYEVRDAWYEWHLQMRHPPFYLKQSLEHVAPYEAKLAVELPRMAASMAGSCEMEEEAKRRAAEVAYTAEVDRIIAARAANPSAPLPPFPTRPPPYIAPRALTFGFDASITRCILPGSPPRTVSIMYRRDAAAFLADFMLHASLLHQLADLATHATIVEIVHFLLDFQRCEPNPILRSHLWLHLTQAQGGMDPALDLFQCLQAEKYVPVSNHMAPAIAAIPSVPPPVDGHWNSREMLVRAHVAFAPSLQRIAQETLQAEAAARRSGTPTPMWSPATGQPLRYADFIGRMQIPLYNYIKLLLGHNSQYRKSLLTAKDGSTSGFMQDWNILRADALEIDRQWHERFLGEQADLVSLPEGPHPDQHPLLYAHHNSIMFVGHFTSLFLISHTIEGLAAGLFSNAELEVTFWCLEHHLDHNIRIRCALWRDISKLIPLTHKPSAASKKKSKDAGKKAPCPPEMPMTQGPLSIPFLLMQAQQNLCRGLIQLHEALRRLRLHTPNDSAAPARPAVLIPCISPSIVDSWYSHRFGEFELVHEPRHRPYRLFQQMQSALQSEGYTVESVMDLASKSFARAKETLTTLHTVGAPPGGPSTPAQDALRLSSLGWCWPRQMHPLQMEYVRSLQRIVVSNQLLTLTYSKTIAQAQAADGGKGKPLRLDYRWEPQTGRAYVGTNSNRVMPFPILQLNPTR